MGKKLGDLTNEELKKLLNNFQNTERKSKNFKNYGQFKRKKELKMNNYSLKDALRIIPKVKKKEEEEKTLTKAIKKLLKKKNN